MDKEFRHSRSVRVEKNETGFENEYDQYDRCTFHKMPSGYWCLYFYDEPKEGERVNHTPFEIVHKYWDYYNGLNK